MAKVLYTHGAATGGAASRRPSAGSTILPYIVSSDVSTFGGVLGAVVHVAAWTTAIITDMTVFTGLSPSLHEASHDFQVTALVTTLAGFFVLLSIIVGHLAVGQIPAGGLHPTLLALMRIFLFVSLIMTLLQLEGAGGADAWSANATLSNDLQDKRRLEYRAQGIIGVVSKVAVVGFLTSQ